MQSLSREQVKNQTLVDYKKILAEGGDALNSGNLEGARVAKIKLLTFFNERGAELLRFNEVHPEIQPFYEWEDSSQYVSKDTGVVLGLPNEIVEDLYRGDPSLAEVQIRLMGVDTRVSTVQVSGEVVGGGQPFGVLGGEHNPSVSASRSADFHEGGMGAPLNPDVAGTSPVRREKTAPTNTDTITPEMLGDFEDAECTGARVVHYNRSMEDSMFFNENGSVVPKDTVLTPDITKKLEALVADSLRPNTLNNAFSKLDSEATQTVMRQMLNSGARRGAFAAATTLPGQGSVVNCVVVANPPVYVELTMRAPNGRIYILHLHPRMHANERDRLFLFENGKETEVNPAQFRKLQINTTAPYPKVQLTSELGAAMLGNEAAPVRGQTRTAVREPNPEMTASGVAINLARAGVDTGNIFGDMVLTPETVAIDLGPAGFSIPSPREEGVGGLNSAPAPIQTSADTQPSMVVQPSAHASLTTPSFSTPAPTDGPSAQSAAAPRSLPKPATAIVVTNPVHPSQPIIFEGASSAEPKGKSASAQGEPIRFEFGGTGAPAGKGRFPTTRSGRHTDKHQSRRTQSLRNMGHPIPVTGGMGIGG